MHTTRLQLREFTHDDAAFVLRLLNEPSFLLHIGDKRVRDEAQARAYLDTGPIASYRAHGFGLWLVACRATGQPMGMCGLIRRDALPDVDLGYAFLPAFWGQGLAREAASATVAAAASRFGLRRLLAIVAPANTRSIHLLETLGFGFERMVQMAPGEPELRLFARSLTAAADAHDQSGGSDRAELPARRP